MGRDGYSQHAGKNKNLPSLQRFVSADEEQFIWIVSSYVELRRLKVIGSGKFLELHVIEERGRSWPRLMRNRSRSLSGESCNWWKSSPDLHSAIVKRKFPWSAYS